MVVHAFIPSTREANTGQPGLHRRGQTDRQIHLHVLADFYYKSSLF